MTTSHTAAVVERPAYEEFRKAIRALCLEVAPSIVADVSVKAHAAIKEAASGHAEMIAALEAYEKALDWVAADSFDMCPECLSRIDHSRSNGRAALAKGRASEPSR